MPLVCVWLGHSIPPGVYFGRGILWRITPDHVTAVQNARRDSVRVRHSRSLSLPSLHTFQSNCALNLHLGSAERDMERTREGGEEMGQERATSGFDVFF